MENNIVAFPGSPAREKVVPAFAKTSPSETLYGPLRSRSAVQADIDKHKAARERYAKAVAWLAAAESENLPPANIEAARQEQVELYQEMQASARNLLVSMPTDPKGLIDLLMYLEKNYSVLPQEIRHNGNQSLALYLLCTVRLSLREIAKYGKYGPTS